MVAWTLTLMHVYVYVHVTVFEMNIAVYQAAKQRRQGAKLTAEETGRARKGTQGGGGGARKSTEDSGRAPKGTAEQAAAETAVRLERLVELLLTLTARVRQSVFQWGYARDLVAALAKGDHTGHADHMASTAPQTMETTQAAASGFEICFAIAPQQPAPWLPGPCRLWYRG